MAEENIVETPQKRGPGRPPKEDETATKLEALEQSNAELRAMVNLLLKQQVTPDTIWAKQQQRDEKIQNRLDEIAAYIGLTSQYRTQLEANKMFPKGERLFKTRLGPGGPGDAPEVIIRADNDTDVMARYQKVCGITQVRNEDSRPELTAWMIQDVTNDSAAQQAVNEVWTYTQPA